MQITESQLRQQIRFLLKEEVYGTIATVYHGSIQPPEEFLKIFETGDLSNYKSTGWEPGKGIGSSYGHGMYSVWMKTNHQTFKGEYGDWIYKFKVNLYGFIIFDEDICKKVYGKSITPLEQLNLIGKKDVAKTAKGNDLLNLKNPLRSNTRSANIADKLSNFLKGRVNGLVFFGNNDGPVVLIYDPDIVTPMAWTKRDINTGEINPWTPWNASEIKLSLKRASNAGAQVDPERLQSKSKNNNFNIEKIATNEKMFEKVYSILSTHEKMDIAQITQSDKILTKLSYDKSDHVRINVVQNESLPSNILIRLSDDNNEYIRHYIASFRNVPKEIIEKLANDSSDYVKEQALQNPSISPEALAKILRKDSSYKTRLFALTNPSLPREIFEEVIKSGDIFDIESIAQNMSCPKEILENLLNHPNGNISYNARRTLSWV